MTPSFLLALSAITAGGARLALQAPITANRGAAVALVAGGVILSRT